MTESETEPEADRGVSAAVARYRLPVDDTELPAVARARDAMRALARAVESVDAASAVEPAVTFSPGPDARAGGRG